MNLDKHSSHSNGLARGASAPRASLRAWSRLVIGAALFVLFLVAGSYIGRHVPLLRAWGRGVDTYDLRPSAIYYTDYEASSDAEISIRNSMEFSKSREASQKLSKADRAMRKAE